MIETDVALLFFATSLLLALAPGPDNLYVLAQSTQHGARAGMAVTLGLCSGLVGHTAAVALGLAALFQVSPLAFTLLKLIGAGYLLYLAWLAFRAETSGTPTGIDALDLRRLYRRGVLMNLSNPKVSIFFLAFLPQFTQPERGGVVAQILLLGGLFILAALIVFGTISLLAGRIGRRYRESVTAQRLINRAAAILFVGLALRLVLGPD